MTRITRPFSIAISLVAIGTIIAETDAFGTSLTKTVLAPTTLGMAEDPFREFSVENDSLLDRRSALLGGLTAAAALACGPSPAHALKQKNEALCGTGFFEHIYEYKCTAIGDIEDEGYSKGLSQAETGLTDSLMGKLGVDTGDAFGDYDASKKKGSESKASKTETVASNSQSEQ